MSLVLTIMSAIRYGSGSDYFAYMWHYKDTSKNLFRALTSESHMNIGYKAVMSCFKALGFSYEAFIFILSIVLMGGITYLIWRNCRYKTMSLLVFYSIYYHIYINSALRQGITLVLFLWAFFTYLKKDKFIKYSLVILIGSLFHYSILITLIFPIIKFMYKIYADNKWLNLSLIVISIISFIFKGERLLHLVGGMFGITIHYESSSASILAILLRVILLGFILILYKYADKSKVSDFDKFQIYSYFIGVVIFIAVSNTPTLSRLTEFFSILDVFIIGNIIYHINNKSLKLISIIFSIMLVGVVFIKDQMSFINQGDYYEKSVLKYPYVTIFNKEKIFRERHVIPKFIPREYRYRIRLYRSNILQLLMKE